jgi:hypothetical protein
MDCSFIENAFWTNLLLLGFDKDVFAKHYGIPFDRGMFRNSNITGMEVLFRFLFEKISSEKTKQVSEYSEKVMNFFETELEMTYSFIVQTHLANYRQETRS